MPSRTVLVTGGASFLGEHLAAELARAGAAVRLLDRAPAPPWARAMGAEYVRGDVREAEPLGRALAGVDAVVHAAFASPREPVEAMRTVNEDATRALCSRARAAGVRRLVLVSSTIVAADPRRHPVLRSSGLGRLDLYRQSRAVAERIALDHAGPLFTVAVARPATFLGPGGVTAFAFLFDWVRRGRAVPVLGTGRARYQLLEVRDLADGLCRLATGEASGVFHFGARDVHSVREELGALLTHAGTGARLRFVPPRLACALVRGFELLGGVPLSEWHQRTARDENWILDVSRAEALLGWRAARSNTEALIEAYDWYVWSVTTRGSACPARPAPRAHRALRWLVERLLGPG